MQINYYIFFSIAGFINLIFLMIIFYSRRRYNLFENNIYKALMICTFLGIINEIVMVYFVPILELMPLVKEIVAKSFLLITELWIFLLALYTSIVSNNLVKKDEIYIKRDRNILLSLYAVCAVITSFLPIEYAYNSTMDSWLYTYGLSTKMVFVTSLIFINAIMYYIIRNKKYIKIKKFFPVYIYLALSIVVSFVQQIEPEALLISFVESLIMFIMYFTIENPDMKLLEELHKSKEISDNANEEKTMFLYNMTQDIRSTTNEIDANVNVILDSHDVEEIHDYARDIKVVTAKFNSMTNDILDISKLDDSNIKIYNSKYNVKTIIKEFVTMYGNICKNKNIDFRSNIDHDIPDMLYGDSISLKEAISIILDNSSSNTKDGYIEFNVNTIIKNNICRLIISIEDSGIGIKSEELEKVKIKGKSLGRANKLVTLMGGAMMLSSNYGYGTKVKIILDQRIENVNNDSISKYASSFEDINLLMVDDSDAGIKIVDKLLKGSNIKMESVNNGKDCIELIKLKKYDIILIDEELTQITGAELLKKIKTIRNFKTPVLLLTKDNNYEYNEEYKKLGFSDYLLKPLKKENLLNKINEYAKKDK